MKVIIGRISSRCANVRWSGGQVEQLRFSEPVCVGDEVEIGDKTATTPIYREGRVISLGNPGMRHSEAQCNPGTFETEGVQDEIG